MVAPDPITLSGDLEPWEQQPGESKLRYGQFCLYRDLGRTRTVAEAARRLDRNVKHIRQTAAAYHWADRAAAWDAGNDRITRLALLDERILAARDDARILRALRKKTGDFMVSLKLSELDAATFVRLLDVLMRHGRMLFGDAGALFADLGEEGAGDDPAAAELAALEAMTPQARAEYIRDLTRQAEARLAATSGLDDP